MVTGFFAHGAMAGKWARTLCVLTVALNGVFTVSAAAGAEPGPATLAGLTRECTRCHGSAERAPEKGVPSLSGQSRAYLVKQLTKFRKQRPKELRYFQLSERYHIGMEGISFLLTEAEVMALASYFSDQACITLGKAADTPATPVIVTRCLECHGDVLNPAIPHVPKISGQAEAYLAKQLTAFREAIWTKSKAPTFPVEESPDYDRYHWWMGQWVARMPDGEIKAIAGYFSTRSCD